MFRLRLKLVAIREVNVLTFDKSFYDDQKEVVYSQATCFIGELVKQGWSIVKQEVDFTNLSN